VCQLVVAPDAEFDSLVVGVRDEMDFDFVAWQDVWHINLLSEQGDASRVDGSGGEQCVLRSGGGRRHGAHQSLDAILTSVRVWLRGG